MTEAVREMLIVTVFLLLILDRSFALFAIKIKATRILRKRGQGIERFVLEVFTKEFLIISAGTLLIFLGLLLSLQVWERQTLSNDVGRAVFAGFGFLLAAAGTLLNVCIERLDLKS